MKKLSNLLFSAVIFLFFGVLILGISAQKDNTYSYYENRSLAAFPSLQRETLLDGSWFTQFESFLCDHAAIRETIQTQSTWLDLYVFHRPVVNEVVVSDSDVLLPYEPFEAVDEASVTAAAETLSVNLASLNDLVTSYGGTYCYFAVPCQYVYCEDRYPFYLNNRSTYTDLSIEALTKVLAEKGVPFMDLGSIYAETGWDISYSSTVDNHFSIKGAYLAYQAIIPALNQLSGKNDLPLITEDQLTFTPVDRYYMGSRTRKLFNLITNDEQLYRADPVTPVSFTRYDWGSDTPGGETVYITETGEDALTYSMYMGGDISITEINTSRSELPTVLIYGDSFTNAVECVLYLSCDTMYSIDLRHYTEQTLSAFIEETQPDYVFCLRDYEAVLSTDGNGGT